MRKLFLFLLIISLSFPSFCQSSPKREMRAAWIVTVYNTDWPSNPKQSAVQTKEELIELIEFLHSIHVNAVILQVRPAGDVFYDSTIEPWSYWLTGRQGEAPVPYFDPLQTTIEICHARGMEVHAWFNPFRADLRGPDTLFRAAKHITQTHPEWLLKYGKRFYMDPGTPAVRNYVVDVIQDVVFRYDIDAVHLDDYFYPYRIPKVDFPDSLSYERYGRGQLKDDWRRDNINTFIGILNESIRSIKPDMKIGISPFGVWRNGDRDPQGSATKAGQTSYDDLYADVRKWLLNGWIDYVAPQLYFSRGYAPADYRELLDWWSRNSFGRHIYIGQSLYKINNNHDLNWDNPREIPEQIRLNRTYAEVQGSMHYSTTYLKLNPLGVTDSLQANLYPYKALPPTMKWLDNRAPEAPNKPKVRSKKEGLRIQWEDLPEETAYIAIYRFPQKKIGPRSNPEVLKEIIGADQGEWTDQNTEYLKRYSYIITALDKHFNESKGSPSAKRRKWSKGKKKKKKP